MGNVNNPVGLEPVMRTQAGGATETELWTKQSSYGYAIYKWDPVTLVSGYLKGPASGITPGTTRYLGVALNWAVASVLSNHLVMCDPDDLFVCSGDGSAGSNLAQAYLGQNANLNLTGTAGGGVTRDNSGVQITESTVNTTSSLDVKLLGLYQSPDNAFGAYARMEIKFNKHLRTAEVTAT